MGKNEGQHEVSSEQLMHFVTKQDYLVEILNHDFYPRLCCEDTLDPFFKENVCVYIPMKCFCDIPLKAIENHMNIYGEYGIGFKKEWGINSGLTPVIYYNKLSPYVEHIRKIFNPAIDYINEHAFDQGDELWNHSKNTIVGLRASFSIYKPVFGYNGRINQEDYFYYNEREWRYIIPNNSRIPLWLAMPREARHPIEFLGDRITEELRNKHQIEFSYDDIEFVIIPEMAEKEIILHKLQKLNVSQKEVEKIEPKITTYKELINRP